MPSAEKWIWIWNMYISVFNKNRPYLHVSLRGIFKPDPKDFFLQKVPYSIILRQNWVLGRLPKKGPVYLLNESKQVSSKNLPEILCFFWELVFKLMKPKDTYLHNELCQRSQGIDYISWVNLSARIVQDWFQWHYLFSNRWSRKIHIYTMSYVNFSVFVTSMFQVGVVCSNIQYYNFFLNLDFLMWCDG